MKQAEIKKMSYKKLEKKLADNRVLLDRTKDLKEKRRLILEDHEIMKEMDRRWQIAEERTWKRG